GNLIGSQITASVPAYSPARLSLTTEAALGFRHNATSILNQIQGKIREFGDGKNPINAPVATVQVDIVARSMGGDVARTLPLLTGFASDNTFGRGIIHKLITIDT